jgi:HK97 gp10 family phage protein
MSMTFDVSKLKVDLERVRQHMTTKAARKAVVAGAEVIGAAMIERTPVLVEKMAGSDSLEPGELKANIRVRGRTAQDGSQYALVGPAGKQGEISRVAHLVEYGHRTVTGGESRLNAAGKLVGGGKVHEVDVPAHPFLRPAFEESASEAANVVAETLRIEMREAVKA